jgi:hypothetical protein
MKDGIKDGVSRRRRLVEKEMESKALLHMLEQTIHQSRRSKKTEEY